MNYNEEDPDNLGRQGNQQSFAEFLKLLKNEFGELLRTRQRSNRFVNYFEGATIHNIVINGTMTRQGDEHYYSKEAMAQNSYSDEVVAQALVNITGKGRPIDSKQKWAGALWVLRWECNYPAKALEFCERISQLPLPEDLPYRCEYNNIRPLATLSFLNADPRDMEHVKYSKNDEATFIQLREVAMALLFELRKAAYPT